MKPGGVNFLRRACELFLLSRLESNRMPVACEIIMVWGYVYG